MDLFEFNVRLFRLIGILPTDETTSAFIVAAVKAILIEICFVILLIGCSALSLVSHTDDTQRVLHTVLLCSGGYLAAGEYAFLKWNAKNVMGLIEAFQDLVNGGNCDFTWLRPCFTFVNFFSLISTAQSNARRHYEEAEHKGRRSTKLGFVIAEATHAVALVFMLAFSVLYYTLSGNLNTSEWYYLYDYR